jgi:hypothetical protein
MMKSICAAEFKQRRARGQVAARDLRPFVIRHLSFVINQ